jgi:serine/threonine protein kinase, bacterial
MHPRMQLSNGATFAGYTIVRLLGSGGMGEVYLAEHPRLPRQDALKILGADISANEDYRQRFIREADLAAKLWHPNIVRANDRGEYDGQLWIAMDFVDGDDAAHRLAQRYPAGMPLEQVTQIVMAVASALDYAHKQGLLHRDVKPGNIMLSHQDVDGDQRILLADFGIARDVDDISGLTTTNMAVGTVAYAAPEQLMGEDVDGRADQYALAATAYHLLTGAQLYPHSNPAVVISRHLNASPPKLADTRAELTGLDAALAVALSKDPNDRFARCSDFARALADQSGSPVFDISAAAPTRSAPLPRRPETSSATSEPAESAVNVPRRRWLMPTVAAAVLVVGAGAAFTWWPWTNETRSTGPTSRTTPATTPQALPNTGPLTGIYSADFGPELELGTAKVLSTENAHGEYEIRSACTPTGCVATANATSGPTLEQKLVFDDLDGQWVAVDIAPNSSPAISSGLKAGCEQALSPEVWETVVLRPQPDGSLSGQYSATNSNNCNTSRTVKFMRTGDVDVASISDPSKEPPRVASPAEGFLGHYRYTHTGPSGVPILKDGYVHTDCLRTGERCMSYFSTDNSAEPFVFADGQWTLHYDAGAHCGSPDGPRTHINRSAELALPQPAPDPIDIVFGHGQEQATTGPCAGPLHYYDLKFERTGD